MMTPVGGLNFNTYDFHINDDPQGYAALAEGTGRPGSGMPSGGNNYGVQTQNNGTTIVNQSPEQPAVAGGCSVTYTVNINNGTATETVGCDFKVSSAGLNIMMSNISSLATSFVNICYQALNSAATFVSTIATNFGNWVGGLFENSDGGHQTTTPAFSTLALHTSPDYAHQHPFVTAASLHTLN